MPVFHQPHNSMGNHTYNVYIYEGVDYGLHFHKNHEVIYIIEGEASCTVNGRTKILRKGDFAFCLSNEIHAIKAEHGLIWIGVFSEDFIHEFKKHRSGRVGSDFSFRCAEGVMTYLRENLIKEALSDVFLIKSCLYALCSEYLRQITLQSSNDKHTALMGRIVEYIEENYRRDISLSQLAEALGYEYFYFSRIFNRLFSMSFNDYINLYRFNEACLMLIETDMTVAKISAESGFKSIRSFNYIFKKLSGASPREYRSRRLTAQG